VKGKGKEEEGEQKGLLIAFNTEEGKGTGGGEGVGRRYGKGE
jgi:hypothetical protein